MKKILVVAMLGILSASSAYADGHGRGGDWGRGDGWGWRGDWLIPALITGAIIYDATRPQMVYVQPAPVYVVEPPQTTYYESGRVYTESAIPISVRPSPSNADSSISSSVPPPPASTWYFCAASNAYYPYVSSCPGGWQAVPSTPPDISSEASSK